jgi:hypothetical protein
LGYDELLQKWKYIDNPQDPEFKKYLDFIKAIPNDPNAAALDSGFNVLLLFIESADLALKYVLLQRLKLFKILFF